MRRVGIFIVLYILSEIILLSQLDNFLSTKKKIILEDHKTTIQNEFKVIINILRDLSQNSFKGFINKPQILDAFKKRDRELLYTLLKKDYSYLKILGFKQLHFHLPNNNSFLRMHQPDIFGDNLADTRYSVAYTNQYKKYIEGIEVGRIVPGYRFVYPLFVHNEYIGSVELSFSIDKIANEIERVYKTHTHYLIKKSIFNQKVFSQFQKFYTPSIEHPDYIKLNRTYHHKMELWYDNIKYKREVDKGLKTKDIFSFELETTDKKHKISSRKIVTFLPIMNIEQTSQSYLIFYSKNENLQDIEDEKFYTKAISSSLLFLLFLIAYMFYNNKETILKAKDILERRVKIKTNKLNKLNIHLENINKKLELKIHQEIEKSREKDLQIFLQSKKASMGEMIGAIAHQWRQPLNELSIRIQKLHYDYHSKKIDESYLDDFIKTNKQTINFMSKTIDGFRNFFRLDKEKKDFFVKEVIDDLTRMLSAQFEHYRIQVEVTGQDFPYNGFKTEFQQVILNILNNSKDAILDKKILDGKITINIDDHHITLCDNGGGIPKDIEDKIFDLYFTTKDEGKGTGMGLYISKVIIEDNMQGKLYLENSDTGAIFHIKL